MNPNPATLARLLRDLATRIETDGTRATRMLELLAARGWPTSTLGDGGASNGASILVDDERVPVTSTEAAALTPNRWAGKDDELRKMLRTLAHLTIRTSTLIDDALAHAQDVDEVPAGTGACEACSKVIRPDARHPDRRLRAGLCDACRKHWDRSGITDRGDWLLTRRALLGHKEGADALARRFTSALEHGQLGDTA